MKTLKLVGTEIGRRPKGKPTLTQQLAAMTAERDEWKQKYMNEQERADNLFVQNEDLRDQLENDYVPIDDTTVAVGDQVVMELEDAEDVEALKEIRDIKWHADLGSEHHKEEMRRKLEELL